jgi:hypothetical protein
MNTRYHLLFNICEEIKMRENINKKLNYFSSPHRQADKDGLNNNLLYSTGKMYRTARNGQQDKRSTLIPNRENRLFYLQPVCMGPMLNKPSFLYYFIHAATPYTR